MTAAFEKWMDKTQHDANCWEYVCSSEQAHFWLTRLVAEIEREAATAPEELCPTGDYEIAWAVREIKAKFGL